MFTRCFMLLCMVAAAVSAHAQEETYDWGQVNGWIIRSDTTQGFACFAFNFYDDGTSLRIGFREPGAGTVLYVAVGNPKWQSIEGGKDYDLQIQLDNEPPWPSPSRAFMLADVPFLFIGTNQVGFVDQLMRKHSMRIYYDGVVVANLSLRGSYAAMQEVGNCQKAVDELIAKTSPKADPFKPDNGVPVSHDPFAQ